MGAIFGYQPQVLSWASNPVVPMEKMSVSEKVVCGGFLKPFLCSGGNSHPRVQNTDGMMVFEVG